MKQFSSVEPTCILLIIEFDLNNLGWIQHPAVNYSLFSNELSSFISSTPKSKGIQGDGDWRLWWSFTGIER